jgi:hypothetical protein
MPTTMKLIAKTTLTSNPVSVAFDNIPGTYTDLYLVCSMRSTRTGTSWVGSSITFNAAENWTDYSGRYLQGDGAAVYSGNAVTTSYVGVGISVTPTAGHTANSFSNGEVLIPNYAGATNKSFSSSAVGETNGTTAFIHTVAGLWSSTAAITKITVWCNGNVGGHAFSTDSSFFLYGITKS